MKKLYLVLVKATGEQLVFGSLKAIFHERELGISLHYYHKYQRKSNKGKKDLTRFENEFCVITKTILLTVTNLNKLKELGLTVEQYLAK